MVSKLGFSVCGKRIFQLFCLPALTFLLTSAASAADLVRFRQGAEEVSSPGKVLVHAVDGGVLLLTPVGVLVPLSGAHVVDVESDPTPFQPALPDEVAEYWLQRLPQGFVVYQTAHYVVLHNTSRDFARWCGALLERLYSGFTAYFTNKGLTIDRPEFPLAVAIFATRKEYVSHCRAEVGDAIEQIQGHYNLETNRVTMYDLTGSGGTARAAEISRLMLRPEVRQNIATVIHEATHQLANNANVTCRWTDTPQWVSEGLAMFFEVPDLRSTRGWATVGALNQDRLSQFRRYLTRRPADSLQTLLQSNERFQDTGTAKDAYAEAWALTYFLLQQKSQLFLQYLSLLREKPPLVYDPPETRLAEFRQVFGNLEALDREFLRFIARLR